MRCRRHLADGSSTVGVCASCLRDRLTAIMAAQARYHVLRARVFEDRSRDDGRRSDSDHAPSMASRYRKSDSPDAWKMRGDCERRLWNTAQVGFNGAVKAESARRKRSDGVRAFSFFLCLFRSKQGKTGLDFGAKSNYRSPAPIARFNSLDPCVSSETSFQKGVSAFPLEKSVIGDRRRAGLGISPDMFSDVEETEQCRGGSSGSSSESPQGWRRTPKRPTPLRCGAPNTNMSGLKFCLSPLVQVTPKKHHSHKTKPPELTPAGHTNGKNRSRKLADAGRYNPNY